MVLFFICTLAVSLIAMVLLLSAKRYELSTGRVIFAGARPRVNFFFETAARWGRTILPALARQHIERVTRAVLTKLQLLLAQIIVTLENTLEYVLSAVRERTEDIYMDREPSAFLREVADHKKNLLKKSRPRDSVQE